MKILNTILKMIKYFVHDCDVEQKLLITVTAIITIACGYGLYSLIVTEIQKIF